MTESWIVTDHVSFNRVEGDIILMDTRHGKYFSLDEVASLIWEVVADTGSQDHAVKAILERYDIDEETVRQDVDEALSLWHEKGFLQRIEP